MKGPFEEKPYQANVCTECPDARKRKMIDDLFADTTTDEEKETAWEELKNIMKNSQFVPPPPSTGSCHQ